MIYSILYYFLIINILIQLGYWGILFSKFYFKKNIASSANKPLPALSIVICAKNEAQNLSQNLVYILQQNYKTFEVIVVDDGSDDASLLVLADYKTRFPFLNILNLDKNAPKILQGKKQALTAGIAAAQHDWVLLTDADCRPRSVHWAREMMETAVFENKEIVLGYSPLGAETLISAQKNQTLIGVAMTETKSSAPILTAWIRLETIYTALQYISFAHWGLPYMGVGRNILYKKSLFLENDGLTAHADLHSGDDDLFVRDVATAANTTVCLAANTFVDSAAKTTWRGYVQQKTRHLSTSTSYKPLIQILLGVLSASHLLVYIFGITYCFFYFNISMVQYNILLLLVLRWLVQVVQLFCVSTILKEKNIATFFFVFDIMLFLYLFAMSFSFLKKDKKW